MGKPTIYIGENKDADQLLAIFCGCTGRLVSDLFGNHIVGFPRRRLIYVYEKILSQGGCLRRHMQKTVKMTLKGKTCKKWASQQNIYDLKKKLNPGVPRVILNLSWSYIHVFDLYSQTSV